MVVYVLDLLFVAALQSIRTLQTRRQGAENEVGLVRLWR